jgi:hypothetical protein
MQRKVLMAVVAALAMAGAACAPVRPVTPWRYARPDTTQAQFMKDRYECLQEAEQRVSGAVVNPYGGAASSRVVVNCGVWVSCLGARG